MVSDARILAVVAFGALLSSLTGCIEVRETRTRLIDVALPDGARLRTEVAETPETRASGLMGRESLPVGEAMLFVYEQSGRHSFWMANCLIPLDIIWMNAEHHVVDLVENAPPCKSGGQNCPTYGGILKAQYVLELPGGQAAAHRIQIDSVLQFR